MTVLPQYKSIYLADDDLDDCMLFQEVLNEISVSTHLTTAHDGVELMEMLSTVTEEHPFILFLDLNMPRKNGFQCLEEIRKNDKLKFLDVIILSTSYHQELIDRVFRLGARDYFQKPSDFNVLKRLVEDALRAKDQPMNENFEDLRCMRSSKP